MQWPRDPDVTSMPGIDIFPNTLKSDLVEPHLFHSWLEITPKSFRIGYKVAVPCPLLIKTLSINLLFFSSNLTNPPCIGPQQSPSLKN